MTAGSTRRPALAASVIASAFFCIAASAATAQQQSTRQTESDQPPSSLQQWRGSHVLLAPSRELVGRDLLGEDEDWGTVKFLMIDVADGEVLYALASAERVEQFVAVPWDLIDTDNWTGEGLSVSAPVEELERARRFDVDDIYRLTTPVVATKIGDEFARVTDPVVTDSPVLVFGQAMVATVTRPVAQVENQLRGSVVMDADGMVIGTIDDIMIDVDAGRVPYVLVATGDYPGNVGNWWPIPPQALTWDAATDGYMIDRTEAELRELGLFGVPEVPVAIRQTRLDNLYGFFDLDPYEPGD